MFIETNLWHRRLADAKNTTVEHMSKNPSYRMNCDATSETFSFKKCMPTKATKKPETAGLISDSQLMIIYTDVCVPFTYSTSGGKNLFVMFLATPHMYTSVRLIKSRSEVFRHCFDFISCMERNRRMEVLRVHGDNAKEFLCMTTELMK